MVLLLATRPASAASARAITAAWKSTSWVRVRGDHLSGPDTSVRQRPVKGIRSSEEKNSTLPASKALIRYFRNKRRNSRERTRTGKKNPARQETHSMPSVERPPPETTQFRWGC